MPMNGNQTTTWLSALLFHYWHYPSHKKEEEVVKRAYEVMNILRSGLSETSNILGPTPKPIARTHNLYHYQILIKYRLEDELSPTLNQVLALTQERENSELRLSIDHEPQQFL